MKLSARLCLTGDSGVIAPATAVVMAVLIGMVGLVTDTSVWYAQRRQLQGVTDAAALAAARYASNSVDADSRALDIIKKNIVTEVSMSVDKGYYCPSMPVGTRFQSAKCPGSVSTEKNAVRVLTTADTPLFLSKLFSSSKHQISTTATAAVINQAGLQAGSGLASLNNGVANAVLMGLTGGKASLSAVAYDGLLNTNVDVLTFLDALAVKLNIKAGNYSSLLNSTTDVGNIIAAQVAVLDGQQNRTGQATAALAGLKALAVVSGGQSVKISDLFNLGLLADRSIGSSTSNTGLHAGLNLWQLTTFSLQLANGKNFVAQNAAFTLGSLASIKVSATAIEPPVDSFFSFGPVGTSVHTAQVRLQLSLGVLDAGNGNHVISVPIYLEVAAGDAEITAIDCRPFPNTTVTVAASTGAARAYVGTANSLVTPVTVTDASIVQLNVLNIPILNVTLSAYAEVLRNGPRPLVFSQRTMPQPVPPSEAGVIGQLAHGANAAIPAVWARPGRVPPTSNLLGGLSDLKVKSCLLALLCGNSGALLRLLSPVLANLDPVIDGLLRALGIQLGYVDVSVTGVRCGMPVLVS